MRTKCRPATAMGSWRRILAGSLLAALAMPSVARATVELHTGPAGIEWSLRAAESSTEAAPPLPPTSEFPVQLVLDDDTAEGDFGIAGARGTARQFLWFNRFTPATDFVLEEVWVLFPAAPGITAGSAVELVVFTDDDGDPATGADLVASFSDVVQVADGDTFSIYPLPTPVSVTAGQEVLLGVVPRFITSGVTALTQPAALDTDASQGRSWLGIWSGDPPEPPVLNPAPDLYLGTVDGFVEGNWMIRGFGAPPPEPAVEIPTLGAFGLLLLAVGLAAAALLLLVFRRDTAPVVLLVLAAGFGALPVSAQVLIDDFSTNQGTISDPPGGASSVVTGGADILGQHRDLGVLRVAGAGPVSAGVAGGLFDFTVVDTTPDSRGEATLTWDGDSDPNVLDPTGLGGVDLTAAGTQGGLRLVVGQAVAGSHLVVLLYEDADHVSRAGRVLPAIASSTAVLINFSELVAAPDSLGAADLTQIGAVVLRLGAPESGGSPAIEIDRIETAAPAVAAAKVDRAAGGGPIPPGGVDPGDTLRYRITLGNTGGAAEAVDLDDVLESNLALVPGTVRTTPVARRDQYRTVTSTPLDSAVDGAPSLLANDSDFDGDLLQAVTATGQVTAQGGSVDIDADGDFIYTPPAGFQGVDAFTYTLVATPGDPATDAAGNPIGAHGAAAYVIVDRVPPVITAGNTLVYTENDPPTAIAPALTVTDADSTNLAGATVEISAAYVPGEDLLAFTNTANLTGVFVPASGILTLSGTDTVAAYQAALRSVTYENTSQSPSTADRTVTWTATDGVETSAPATSTIQVISVNDPPVVTTTGGATSFVEDGGAVVVDAGLTITDADNANLVSATVTITNLQDGAAETLAASACAGLTVVPGSGTLAISGSQPLATYQTCLRSVTYNNSSQDPDPTSRIVRFVVNDGTDPSAPADKTVTVTPVNDPPVAGADSWDTVGNTRLVVDLAPLATPHVRDTTPSTFGVLDNDSDPVEGDNVAVGGVVGCADVTAPFGDGPACATANGGSVVLEANGRFTYTPAAGDAAATDTFQYTLVDDGTPAPASAVGTVTIHRFERVWYVKNDATAGGLGRSSDPFDTLAEAQTASVAGDWIFVHLGDGTTTGQAAGITLKASQHLLGEHAGLVLPVNLNGNGSPTTLFAAAPGNRPLLDNTAGNAVSAGSAIPVEIAGLSLAGNADGVDVTTAAALTGSSSLTIRDNQLRSAGGDGLDVNLNAGTTGTLALAITGNTWQAAGAFAGRGADVRTTAGTLNLDLSNNTGVVGGLNVDGSGGGTLNVVGFASNTVHQNTTGPGITVTTARFDQTPGGAYQTVPAGNTAVGVPGDGVGGSGVVLTGVSGDLAFTDLDVFADGGAGLRVTGGGAVNVGAGTGLRMTVGAGVGIVEAIGGPAVDLSGLTADLQLQSVKSTNTATTGFVVTNVADGTSNAVVTAGSGSAITTTAGAPGPAFQVSGGNAQVSYAGTITNSGTGRAVSITGWAGDDAGDDLVLSGLISETGAGILVNGNSGSRAIRFTGGMGILTTTGEGFAATSNTNALGLHVTGTNTVDSTSATGLRIIDTVIGNSNLTFLRVSSGNADASPDPANGIVLTNTGSLGSLRILGAGALGTGGKVQNTTGHGIVLTDTLAPSLAWMQVLSTAGSGVQGTTVTGFSFTHGVIDNSGTALGVGDSNIAFNTAVLGTERNLTGVVTITDNTLTNAYYHGVDIQNFDGTLADATISNNTITSSTSAASSNGSGIRVIANGSATTIANVTRATIAGNVITNFPSGSAIRVQGGNGNAAGPSGTLGVAGSGSDVIAITGNRVAGASTANKIGLEGILATVGGVGQGNFNISGNGTMANPIANVTGTAISVNALGPATVTATVSNNVMAPNNIFAANGVGAGVNNIFGITDAPSLSITISNNVISAVDGNGILAVARNSNGTLLAKILDNQVAAPLTGVRPGIRVDSGTSSGNTTVCLNMSGNTSAGSGGTQGLGIRKQGTVSTTNTFGLHSLSGGTTTPFVCPGTAVPAGTPAVENFINCLNPAGNGTLLISGTSGFTSCSLP
ncbi:MAG: cadherin-like domain-containing protein [Acidobacteria bacterium]|nr:cadherin-like domain-containing protein [Acidobacteriota bacterium]